MRWKYAPPVKNNIPGRIWLRQNIRIEVGEPFFISFSKILCETLEIAAEVYQALKNGGDFSDLALKYSVDPTRDQGGKVGKTDIHLYPDYIQKELKRLKADEFSQPVSFGDKYLIMKRHGF
ncbi:MAG: hypothetical protein CVV24_05120 [Ignavibacteriae bacterium HGW-Ignavibacteriae-3]|nr:MAG: hypothetical protein CVV24_05120 [Ignavibacteriae bacterium HGW-Ignavibacteriae-3]